MLGVPDRESATAPSDATPESDAPPALDRQLVVLARGATLACGVCGRRRGLFRRWVIMADDCPRCGLHFERTEGHYIGAVGINTIVSFGLLVLLLAAFFIATYQDIPAGPWVFGAAAIYGLVPVFYYPISKTLWTAIDLLMRPLEPGEVLPRDEWR